MLVTQVDLEVDCAGPVPVSAAISQKSSGKSSGEVSTVGLTRR